MSGAADPVSEAGYFIRRPPHSTARFLLSGRFFQGQIGDQLLERRRLATQAYDLSRGSSPGLNTRQAKAQQTRCGLCVMGNTFRQIIFTSAGGLKLGVQRPPRASGI